MCAAQASAMDQSESTPRTPVIARRLPMQLSSSPAQLTGSLAHHPIFSITSGYPTSTESLNGQFAQISLNSPVQAPQTPPELAGFAQTFRDQAYARYVALRAAQTNTTSNYYVAAQNLSPYVVRPTQQIATFLSPESESNSPYSQMRRQQREQYGPLHISPVFRIPTPPTVFRVVNRYNGQPFTAADARAIVIQARAATPEIGSANNTTTQQDANALQSLNISPITALPQNGLPAILAQFNQIVYAAQREPRPTNRYTNLDLDSSLLSSTDSTDTQK
jgi:hypothetical protein